MRTTEKVFLPSNATIPPDWVHADDGAIISIEYPSMTSTHLDRVQWHLIQIDKETRLMGCTCEGFCKVGICSHIKKLKWVLKKKTKSTRAVSLEAKLSLSKDYMTAIKLKILEILKDYPRTVDEIEGVVFMADVPEDWGRELGQRVSELYKDGWIEPTGETRATRHGRQATVWEIS